MRLSLLLVIAAALAFVSAQRTCCGNGKCEHPSESCRSCPQDCGLCPACNTCGNRVCDSALGENSCNCPLDCGPCCVDGVCREDRNETAWNCPEDCAVALRLIVVDFDTGVPLNNAAVRCYTPSVTLGPRSSTANGLVTFANAAGATYICTGELFAYLPGTVSATVFPLSTPTVFRLRLKKNPSCIEGTVFDAVTLTPLDTSSVFCQNSDKSFTTETRITGTMGKFYFEPVPYGDWRCFASRSRYFPNSNDGTVEPGKMVTIDIYLNPLPGGIIGTVYNLADNSVVPGVTVTCTHATGIVFPSQITDRVGFYSIQGVPAGAVSCTAELVDFTKDFKTGVVQRSLNTTINFYISELPGALRVLVQEVGTLVPIPNARVECTSSKVPFLPGTTDVVGSTNFSSVTPSTFTCTASASGYLPGSVSGVVVTRNKQTTALILLTPQPGILIITTVDDSTNLILTGVTVTVSSVSVPQLSDATGTTTFTVAAGTYSANGCLVGYICGSKAGIIVMKGQTTTAELRLVPIPGALTVSVIAADTGNALPGATVVVTSDAGFANTSLAPSPSASLLYVITKYGAYRAVGSLSGYVGDTKVSGFIGRNQSATLQLVLTPLPNRLDVTVINNRTGALIAGARVVLSGGATAGDQIATSGATTFQPLGSGTYTATGSATGFGSGSNTSKALVRNDTDSVIVRLPELPCSVRVVVHNSRDVSLVLANATVALNLAGTSAKTDVNGVVNYSIFFDAADSITASLFGFRDNTVSFAGQCSRGGSITVFIPLVEVLILRIAAKDVATPGQPFLPDAVITFNGQNLTTRDPNAPQYRILNVDTLPVTGNILAKATGYNDKTTTFTFTVEIREIVVSLAPQEFTVFIGAQEMVVSGPGQTATARPVFVAPDGTFSSGYNELTGGVTAAEVKRDPKSITIGGFATQVATNNVQRSYVADTQIDNGVDIKGSFFAARYVNVVPTSLSAFRLSLSTDLDNMIANRNTSEPNPRVLFVPNYDTTTIRVLLFSINFKLNAAWINVRVFPVNQQKTGLISFTDNDFVTCTLNTRFSNYNSPAGIKTAVFEYPTTFGEVITSITVGFPTESFSTARSGFRDEEAPFNSFTILANPTAIGYTSFSFTADKVAPGLFVSLGNGVSARDASQKLYTTRDYFLVAGAKRK